jgi:hypothetical protein
MENIGECPHNFPFFLPWRDGDGEKFGTNVRVSNCGDTPQQLQKKKEKLVPKNLEE